MKIKKNTGYHLLAFCIGALAPLPLLIGFQNSDDPDARRKRIPEPVRHLRSNDEAGHSTNDLPVQPSKPQDEGQDFTHNTESRYAEDVSLFLEGRQSVADPGS